MTDTVTRITLTDSQMSFIQHVIDDALNPVQALVDALKATFNYLLEPEGKTWDDFGPDNRINGKAYAIPDTQWVQIGEWLLARADQTATSPTAPVNIHLDWMNVGPSSFTAVG